MSDNVIKSTDLNSNEVEKKTTKKQPAKKAAVKKTKVENTSSDDKILVVFESGASYTSNGIRFTRDNNMQEVDSEQAKLLLSLDNFRLPTQEEVDEYFNSKEG